MTLNDVILTLTEECSPGEWCFDYDQLIVAYEEPTDTHWVGHCLFDINGHILSKECRVVLPLAWLDLSDDELRKELRRLKAESLARDEQLRPLIAQAVEQARADLEARVRVDKLNTTISVLNEGWLPKESLGFVTAAIKAQIDMLQAAVEEPRPRINAILPVFTERTLDEAKLFPSEVCDHPRRSYDEWSL